MQIMDSMEILIKMLCYTDTEFILNKSVNRKS